MEALIDRQQDGSSGLYPISKQTHDAELNYHLPQCINPVSGMVVLILAAVDDGDGVNDVADGFRHLTLLVVHNESVDEDRSGKTQGTNKYLRTTCV